MSDLDAFRTRLRETLRLYWQARLALDVAQDQADQATAQLRAALDDFFKAGGSQDDVDKEVERVEQEL